MDHNQHIKIGKNYKIIKKLGEGSFGQLYIGENIATREKVAIKLEDTNENEKEMLKHEANIYRVLNGLSQIPVMRNFGREGNFSYLVMDLLNESLEDIRQTKGLFSVNKLAKIAVDIINVLEQIHGRGIVHRDIKPQNFLLRKNKYGSEVVIIDFGLSRSYKDENLNHISLKTGRSMVGTARYASLNVHEGITYSRRDDLESVGYMLVYLFTGRLPWQGMKADDKISKYNKIKEVKKLYKNDPKNNSPSMLLDTKLPLEFTIYFNYIHSLSFSDKPNYIYLKNLFINLLEIY